MKKSFFINLVCSTVFVFSMKVAYAGTEYRCAVRLIFDSDSTGSVANYVLGLQIKNPTGRDINGVSLIYKDKDTNITGTAFLDCSLNSTGIKPGSYGECLKTLQRVDGAYINSFGIEKWTEIVNNQLKGLNSIQYCEVLGFAY